MSSKVENDLKSNTKVFSIVCMFCLVSQHKAFVWHRSIDNPSRQMFQCREMWPKLKVRLLARYFLGLVRRFLSAKFWIPLSRLTFNVYLIHMIVILVMLIGSQGYIHYDFFNIVSANEVNICDYTFCFCTWLDCYCIHKHYFN